MFGDEWSNQFASQLCLPMHSDGKELVMVSIGGNQQDVSLSKQQDGARETALVPF